MSLSQYFRRGEHRQNGFRPTVAETIFDARRISITDLFTRLEQIWARRCYTVTTITAGDSPAESVPA